MTPNYITVHCSASKPSVAASETAEDIRKIHKAKGWRDIGYHYFIRRDGSVEKGRADNVQGAHVGGHNINNLGICLSGGVDESNKPEKNYTYEQMHALFVLVIDLCSEHSIGFSDVQGHRDWFGDTNKDGAIDSKDWLKACPCFDVREWLHAKLHNNGMV